MTSWKKVAAVTFGALLIIAACGWYLASPSWTLGRMKAAAEANDAQALSAYIDYPALRRDLKAKITARIALEAQRQSSPLGSLGLTIGSAFVGPVVDHLVSPEGIRAVLFARENERNLPEARTEVVALHMPDHPMIVRRSFSEFLVATKEQPRSGLVFKLHGLSWKLSGIALPAAEG